MAKRSKRKKREKQTPEAKADANKPLKKQDNNKEFLNERIEFPIFDKIKPLFENKAFKFIFLFAVFIISFYILFLLLIDKISFIRDIVAGNIGFLLNLFGVDAAVNGSVVTMKNFSMEVIFECTPLFTILIYFACVLAYPAKIDAKIKGMISGGILIYFIDIIRLFSLAIIGMISPDVFNYIHIYLWQVTLIIVILAIWLFWIDKFTTQNTTKITE